MIFAGIIFAVLCLEVDIGMVERECAVPAREGLLENEEFRQFCKQYGIVLNPQQERAVQAVGGANLLLAVPGSGKTTVLVARLGYMILCKHINPDNILAMTFSKQAAKDMHRRFCKVFGAQLGAQVEFRTIHSVAYQIVRRYALLAQKTPPKLLDDNKALIIEILKEHLKDFPSDSDIAEAQAAITYIKNMSLPMEEIPKQEFAIEKMETVYAKYQAYLNANRLMDFDDQVVFAVQLLKGVPRLLAEYRQRFPYLCVDEAQDTSKAQHELLHLLVGDRSNVFMVGDEDQSIYRFRGAFPQALLDFQDTYSNPNILWMETNYRSTTEIVNLAAQFISRNQNRYPKNMVAHRSGGEAVKRIDVPSRKQQYAAIMEIAKEIPTDTAVIYRDNDSAIPLIDLFTKNQIPYRCPKKEFRFFTNKVVLDVVAFMKLQQDPRDVESFRRICYKSDFYLDKQTVTYACENVTRHGVTFLESLKKQAERFDKIARPVRAFEDHVRKTANMGALQFLRYLDAGGYGTYMEKARLDHNKYELLLSLADENPSVPDFLMRLDQLRELTADNAKDDPMGIILTTAHSSKGLEYDTVYLMDVYDGQFPCATAIDAQNQMHNINPLQEERRLFYVAMTRAKNHLSVFSIKGKPSSFTDEILPPPKPPKSSAPTKSRYSIDQYRAEQEKRALEQAELKRKAAEEFRRREEQKKRGFAEVKDRAFQTEEMVTDSSGCRWLQCERCGALKPKGAFSLIGRRDRPSIGICTECARKCS